MSGPDAVGRELRGIWRPGDRCKFVRVAVRSVCAEQLRLPTGCGPNGDVVVEDDGFPLSVGRLAWFSGWRVEGAANGAVHAAEGSGGRRREVAPGARVGHVERARPSCVLRGERDRLLVVGEPDFVERQLRWRCIHDAGLLQRPDQRGMVERRSASAWCRRPPSRTRARP